MDGLFYHVNGLCEQAKWHFFMLKRFSMQDKARWTDKASLGCLSRKAYPVLTPDSGMNFPPEASTGNGIPF